MNKYYSHNPKSNNPAVNEKGEQTIIKLREKGYTFLEIEKKTGINNRTAGNIYRRYFEQKKSEKEPDLSGIETIDFQFFSMRGER